MSLQCSRVICVVEPWYTQLRVSASTKYIPALAVAAVNTLADSIDVELPKSNAHKLLVYAHHLVWLVAYLRTE